MMRLRHYQEGAINAALNHWSAGGGNALIELATGTGKSLVAAELSRAVVEAGGRVGVVTHVRELVRQNCQTILRAWPQADVGIYSAGLGRRDAGRRVTFASIQTIHNKANSLPPWDLVLVDEAHLIPSKGEGMYRRFIEAMLDKNPDMRVGGLTATPYRLGEGRLDRGEGRLFEATVYRYGIVDGIRDGYLSPLISKAGIAEVDVSRVAKAGGEFKPGALQDAARSVTEAAVAELLERAADRKAWLVFCAGVQHAHEVRDAIRRGGVDAEVVTGETPTGERDRITARFKAGELRCITNANVLTTGFDAPNVDLVGMMRPTLSSSLYVQMIGRGTRLAPGKENCLVLDWAGNVRRHGPVDAVIPREPGKKAEPEDEEGRVAESSMLSRACPDCESLVHIAVPTCPVCGHEWPPSEKPRHDAEADGDTPILSTEKVRPQMLPVITWEARKHEKFNKPPSMRVDITAGLAAYPEWVAFEHQGFARQKAQQWWLQHGGDTPLPASTEEALERFRAGEVQPPTAISVRPQGKFFDIVSRAFSRAREPA